MARLAADRRAAKILHLCARMATEAPDCYMRSSKRKSSSVVSRNLSLGQPVRFMMALIAALAELPTVRVFVTSGTALAGKNLHRSSVIVAPQTVGVLMCRDKRNAGLLEVIEVKTCANDMPATTFVAQRAVGGEGVVRNRWPPGVIPFLRPGRGGRGRH